MQAGHASSPCALQLGTMKVPRQIGHVGSGVTVTSGIALSSKWTAPNPSGILAPMRSLVILLALLLAAQAMAQTGPVGLAVVIDGDTLDVGGQRVRLWGIDAPERDTNEGLAATAYVTDLIAMHGGQVRCQLPPSGQDEDRYGRLVRVCALDGQDLAGLVVSAGHACDWPQFSGGYYAEFEQPGVCGD